MKKKILVLFTGGTIGSFKVDIKTPDGRIESVIGTKSELKKRNIDVTGKEQLLIKKYNDCYNADESIEFKRDEIADVLSENMSFGKWNEITDKIRKYDLSKYDGVIITHGTDTLGYFANYMSMILNDVTVPVFIVSSNYQLEDPRANGNFNFQAACDFIKYIGLPGVYATFRNTIIKNGQPTMENKTQIIYGSRLMQCNPLSNNFESISNKGNVPLATVDSQGRIEITDGELYSILNGKNKYNVGKGSYIKMLKTIRANILMVEPYVGIRYNNYNLKDVDAVLHGLYHSGTTCTDTEEVNNVLSFNRIVKNSESELYVGPFYGKDSSSLYATSKDMVDAGIKFVTNTSKENAYVKLMLAYTLAPEFCNYPNQYGDFVELFLNDDVNQEFINPPIKIKK